MPTLCSLGELFFAVLFYNSYKVCESFSCPAFSVNPSGSPVNIRRNRRASVFVLIYAENGRACGRDFRRGVLTGTVTGRSV